MLHFVWYQEGEDLDHLGKWQNEKGAVVVVIVYMVVGFTTVQSISDNIQFSDRIMELFGQWNFWVFQFEV
jgi:hypothetical protein